MLNNHQKRQLKGLANNIDIKYQIGKKDISSTLLDMLDKALNAKELIKIDVLKNNAQPVMELALDLSSKLHADIVDVLGRVIILYRPSKDNRRIVLLK